MEASSRPSLRSRARRNAKNAAFRVCTVSDFHLRQRQDKAKRTSRQAAAACRMCRLRKIKCSEDSRNNASLFEERPKC